MTLIHRLEDDAALRGTLARLLGSGGYPAKHYSSGAELLEAADSLGDGYILLDINVPWPDGNMARSASASSGRLR
jgi:FixJ family two-component response regulator